MIDTLRAAGATLMSNTQLVTYLSGTQANWGTTYYADSATGRAADLRPGRASPVVDQGAALGAEYKYDLLGIDQTQFGLGWEIGATAFVPESAGHIKAGP
jgi:hypothetical protein